jgi:uncharacterized protein (TIGR02391 family)
MRELLRKLSPREIAKLPDRDLQQAILSGMLERSHDRTGGFVYVNQPAAEIINNLSAMENVQWPEKKNLSEALERNIGRAFKKLLQDELIEPALGFNGQQGAVTLTPEGEKAAINPVDLDRVRIRNSLTREMLHPKLRDKPYNDFANGDPTAAIAEAFKILDIEVQKTAGMPNSFGQNLMQDAFDHANGPLTDTGETETMRRALPKLFAGAVGRFRNTSTHTHRTFPDLYEAMEELMIASRLLRFLDEPGRKRP